MYGFKPKYMRMQVLHKYMFYLIYGYEGNEKLDQQQALSEIASQTTLSEEVKAEMSQIYNPSVDWQMFLPPLPVHSTCSFTYSTLVNQQVECRRSFKVACLIIDFVSVLFFMEYSICWAIEFLINK